MNILLRLIPGLIQVGLLYYWQYQESPKIISFLISQNLFYSQNISTARSIIAIVTTLVLQIGISNILQFLQNFNNSKKYQEGRLICKSNNLFSPIFNQACIFYMYYIYEISSSGHGSNHSTWFKYDYFGQNNCSKILLHINGQEIELVPNRKISFEHISPGTLNPYSESQELQNAFTFITGTTFTTNKAPFSMSEAPGEDLNLEVKFLENKQDFKVHNNPFDLNTRHIDEFTVQNNQLVTIKNPEALNDPHVPLILLLGPISSANKVDLISQIIRLTKGVVFILVPLAFELYLSK